MDAKQIILMLGGPAKVAEIVGGITTQAVSQWRRVPAHHCLAIERALGGRVSVHELRPDIFGSAPHQEDAA